MGACCSAKKRKSGQDTNFVIPAYDDKLYNMFPVSDDEHSSSELDLNHSAGATRPLFHEDEKPSPVHQGVIR
jgi:hypothetical protein